MPAAGKRVGIDLTPLLPGGTNGGVKPLIFEALRIVGEQLAGKAAFVFFTNSSTHGEARSLARTGDELVCIQQIPGTKLPEPALTPIRESNGDREDVLLLLNHRVDVLYCPFGAAHLATPGIPVVACIVDLIHIDYPGSLSPSDIRYRHEYLTETMQVCDSLNCISLYVVGRIMDCFPDYRGDIFYTYNAVQTRFSGKAASPRDLPCREYFFFPSNFWPHKNHEVLLIAYRNYLKRTKGEPWHLVLTGAEDERTEEVKNYAEALHLSDFVHFLGFVDEPYLHKLWQGCSALVFPSLHEGFGIPLLEALHFGKPVVSSSACCLPEVGGDACLFVDARKPLDFADALLEVSGDEATRKRLIRNGKARLAHFDIYEEMKKLSHALLHTQTSKVWNKGLYADGWIGADALIGVPPSPGLWKLKLSIAGRNRPTSVSVFISDRPYGTHEIPTHEPFDIEFRVRDPRNRIRLSVDDPAQLSEADARPLGARLLSASLENEAGEIKKLYAV